MIIKKGEGDGFVAEREDDLSHGSRSHKSLKEKSGGRIQPTTINKKTWAWASVGWQKRQ